MQILSFVLFVVMSGRKKRQKELEVIMYIEMIFKYIQRYSAYHYFLAFGMWGNKCKYLLAISKKPQAITNEVGN